MIRRLFCSPHSSPPRRMPSGPPTTRPACRSRRRAGVAFQRVAMPAAVYEGAAHRDLADLRVFNADGEVVPFAFVPRRPRCARAAGRRFRCRCSRCTSIATARDVDGPGAHRDPQCRRERRSASTPRDGDAAPGSVLGGYVLDARALSEPLVRAGLRAAGDVRRDDDAHAHRCERRSRRLARASTSDATLVDLEYAGQRLTRDRVEIAPTKAKYLRLSWTAGRPGHRLPAP